MGYVVQAEVECWVSVAMVGLCTNPFALLMLLLLDFIGNFVFFPVTVSVFPSITTLSP